MLLTRLRFSLRLCASTTAPALSTYGRPILICGEKLFHFIHYKIKPESPRYRATVRFHQRHESDTVRAIRVEINGNLVKTLYIH